MKWSTIVSYALAAGGALALVALVSRERSQTAEEFWTSVEKRYASGTIDRQQFLRELALAQSQAEIEGLHSVATQVQLERGRVLLELGSFDNARTELAAVAAEGADQREVELLRIQLELEAGEPAAGLELAHSWLARHPDDARAWSLSSGLSRVQADAARDEALKASERVLISESTPAARQCVRELSARPASDPRRIALARDLRAIYGVRLESEVERVLESCARAARANASARDSAGRSLGLEFDPEVLTRFAQLCDEAGLGEEALELLLAASGRPGMADSESAASFLLHSLVERGRWRYGTQAAAAWLDKHQGSTQFMMDACRSVYGARGTPDGNAGVLYNWAMALLLVRTSEIGSAWAFYEGEAFYDIGTREMLEFARNNLSQYAAPDGPEPFPRARIVALRHLADCCKRMGLAVDEREALESVVALDPDGSGESWLRLAELQLASAFGGFRAPDLSYAKGMALLPARSAELQSRWEKIGAQELRALGLDPRNLRQDIQSGLRVRASTGAAPFELYTLARAHLDAGRLYDAQSLLQQLEASVPGFVPTLDLRLEIARTQGRTRDIVDAFLARLSKVGLDERSRATLDALPAGALTSADMRRVVQADPDHSGRRAVARSFAARGDRESALRFLGEIPPSELESADQLFAARLQLQSNDPAAAFARLAKLGDQLAQTPGALEAWIDAGLRAGKLDELRAELPSRAQALALDRPRFLALADRLLASDQAALAHGLLARLDGAGRDLGGGDVLWRLAECALALDKSEEFHALQERAAAFDTHGAVELLALLALPAGSDSDTLLGAVQALRKSAFAPSPAARIALASLAGDAKGLQSALAEARATGPLDPACERLAELPPAAAEARALGLLVLALEKPAFGACAAERLHALDGDANADWRDWFRARMHRAAGEPRAEEALLRALVARTPGFAPAWNRLLELRSSPEDEGESDLDLRLARSAALGDEAAIPAECDWDRSRALERQGKLEDALAAARAAADAAPDSGPIQHHLGRLALGMGRLDLALPAFRSALAQLPSSSGARSTAEFLRLVEEGRAARPALFDAEGERSELEALAARRPDDPRVLLAQARNDLETSANDPSFGADRAAQRLARFRTKHPQSPFESLARGSTESWARFLLELDPQRARGFLEDELELDPGNVDAWALLPRCSAEEGRDEDALAEVAFLQRLAPGREGLTEYLRVRSRGDWSVEGVNLIRERIQRLDPKAAVAPATLAVELRAYLTLGPRGVAKALELCAALDPARLAREPSALRAEIHWLNAIALLARGEGDDLVQARLRTTVLDKLERDPARRPLLLALRGLAQPPKRTP
ncbi:MAG: hypothetical protein IPJ19_13155 [Planctomycetes bacterium]|nr:hypothetical protein [Planctomycetota bacterium]